VDPGQEEPDLPPELQPSRHVQDFFLSRLNVDGSVGLYPWLSLEGQISIRSAAIQAQFLDEEGEVLEGVQSIHHRTEWLVGPSDPRFRARFFPPLDDLLPDLTLSFATGLTLPVGTVEPDPFVLGASGRGHQHIFFGTGTVNPVFDVQGSWDFSDFEVGGLFDAQIPFMRNPYGYRPPSLFNVEAWAQKAFLDDSLRARAGLGLFAESVAQWESRPAANSGRISGLVNLGIFHQSRDNLETYALLRVTVANFTQGGQLYAPAILVVGATADILDFGKPESIKEKGHDHGGGHDHGDEHGHGDNDDDDDQDHDDDDDDDDDDNDHDGDGHDANGAGGGDPHS
jgi:hypothetical protein